MAMSRAWVEAPIAEFTHEALFYTDASGQLETVTEFICAGLSCGNRVVVMLGEQKIAALRKRLGPAGAPVQFIVVDGEVANPSKLIPLWRSILDTLEQGQGCRGVAEPIRCGMPDDRVAEWQLHELLLNKAFEGGGFWLLCTYDRLLLDETTLDEARRSHRFVASSSEPTILSEEFDSDGEIAFYRRRTLMQAPGDAQRFDIDAASVSTARRALFEFAHALGMTDSAAADCALAGHEVVANSLRHGGGTAHLSIWHEHETLICEVKDAGRFGDALAGRTKPSAKARGGRGLWMANQLCDLVQVRSEKEGTVVRLHMSRGSNSVKQGERR
jgi:anti-sigma regulatory factor (Ser/Thr protein kinase)